MLTFMLVKSGMILSSLLLIIFFEVVRKIFVNKSRKVSTNIKIWGSWTERMHQVEFWGELIWMGTWPIVWKSFLEFVFSISPQKCSIFFPEIDVTNTIRNLFYHYIGWFLNRLKTLALFGNWLLCLFNLIGFILPSLKDILLFLSEFIV